MIKLISKTGKNYMKKRNTWILSILAIIQMSTAMSQALNQPANWPNTNWTIGGVYTAAGFIHNPRLESNFGFSDDAAGLASIDNIFAASPLIDLTPSIAVGAINLVITADIIFTSLTNADQLQIGYYDADLAVWIPISVLQPTPLGSVPNAVNCTNKVTLTSANTDISRFTPTQLAGFKYRFYYTDNGGWEQVFCISGSVVKTSSPCPVPSTLTASSITDVSANLSWTENGTATTWDLEILTSGTPPTGTATDAGVTNPFGATGLTASTSYDYYVRSGCGLNGSSVWVGPYNFTTTGGTATCADPTLGTASNETAETADLAWTENGTANLWNIEIVATGVVPTGTATNAGVTNPFTATSLAASTSYDFYVQSDCSGSTSAFAGPFTFSTTATTTCADPTDLAAVNITSTTADLTWTENETAFLWNIELIVAGSTPTGTPTYAGVTSSIFPTSGLLVNTDYDFYIQADCGPDKSSWVGPQAFTTGEVGLDELAEALSLTISPNPSSGAFTIQFEVASLESAQLEILTISGQLIRSLNSLELKNNMKLILSLENEKRGIYLVKLITDKGTLYKKISLQ
jgi:hypothetical protein